MRNRLVNEKAAGIIEFPKKDQRRLSAELCSNYKNAATAR